MTREHWYQSLLITLPIILSGTAMFVGTTWYLSEHIESIREADLQTNADMMARVTGDEARITALEKLTVEHYALDTAFQTEMRGAANAMIGKMADLQVILARKMDMRAR